MTNNYPLPATGAEHLRAQRCARGHVAVIDDDAEVRAAMASLLDLEGLACETHASAESYILSRSYNRLLYPGPCCVLCDVQMPGVDGLELQRRLAALDDTPLLLMSGASGIRDAVQAFHGGALDFLLKPIDVDVLLAALEKAFALSTQRQAQRTRKAEVERLIGLLTARERDVARSAAQGKINEVIAAELGIALRTVKLHRQHAMEKLEVLTVVDLARIADEGGL
jgi:FixJ family two-component response regulator